MTKLWSREYSYSLPFGRVCYGSKGVTVGVSVTRLREMNNFSQATAKKVVAFVETGRLGGSRRSRLRRHHCPYIQSDTRISALHALARIIVEGEKQIKCVYVFQSEDVETFSSKGSECSYW